jgi:hypothetical protein
MTLRLFGSQPTSVFALAGNYENSATFALGWVIERSPAFLKLILADVVGPSCAPGEEVVIDLQRHDEHGGFTDVEIVCKDACHVIIEAKRGWTIPGQAQLETYAHRVAGLSKGERRVVSLSAASQEYATNRLPRQVLGSPVVHRSWADITRLVTAAYRRATSFEEKLWLRQFTQHLEDYVSMQNPRDNMVYVVSLSSQPINEGAGYSWVDVVEKDGRYFHPVGNRWPVLPPNYIAFRYHGALQTVHHIDGYEIVGNLADRNPNWPVTDTDHFVYTLGPAMKPAQPMRTGNIFRNGRVWCAIDTLLSGACETISEARDQTASRLNAELPTTE